MFSCRNLEYMMICFVEMLFRNEMLPSSIVFLQSFDTFVFLNFVHFYYSDENGCVF